MKTYLLGLACAVIAAGGVPALASGASPRPGDLDVTFSGDGKLTTDFGGSDLASAVAALADQLQVVSASDVAPVMARRSRGSTRPAPIRPLAQAQALERLSADTRVSLRSRQPATIDDDGDRVVLEHPGGSLTFATTASDALTAVLAGDPVRVGDLPGPADHENLELVERLMRAGVVVAGEQDDESPA